MAVRPRTCDKDEDGKECVVGIPLHVPSRYFCRSTKQFVEGIEQIIWYLLKIMYSFARRRNFAQGGLLRRVRGVAVGRMLAQEGDPKITPCNGAWGTIAC